MDEARDTGTLTAEHRETLEKRSAISPETIAARGYRTVTDRRELLALGFAPTQCRVPGLLIPLHAPDGSIAGHQFRPDCPRLKGGKPVKYEMPRGTGNRLDCPPRCRPHLGDPAVDLFVTEGVKKADALASQGACAISLNGVYGWRGKNQHGGKTALPDWEVIALNGREVYLVPDSDIATNPKVKAAIDRLEAFLEQRRAKIYCAYLPPDGANKMGVDDFLARGYALSDVLALAQPQDHPEPAASLAGSPSYADIMVRLAHEQKLELFLDQHGNPYAAMPGNRTTIVGVRSREFRRWLTGVFYTRTQKVPPSEALSAALGVLEGLAQFSGNHRSLSVRVASAEGAFWYDLGDGRAVRTTAEGWQVIEKPPVLFRRFPHQKPQVEPQRGGSLESLLGFLPPLANEHDILLLECNLVCGMIPDIPHPLVVPHGPQGSAKTTLHQMIKELLDPSQVRTFAPPRDVAELVQAASHHYVYFLDNLSHLPTWLADCLCRLVSGEGFSKRQLYTDDDDQVYAFRCVAGLNDRALALDRPDILDRSLLFPLERVPDAMRRDEGEFWAAFEKAKLSILGDMFDVLAGAMREYPGVKLQALPRMADFARWGCAVARALRRDASDFIEAYQDNVGRQNEGAVEESPMAQAILKFMSETDEWQGAAADLHSALTPVAEALRVERHPKWPKSADWVWRRILEVKPNLAAMGVEAERGGRTANERLIQLHRGPGKTSKNGVTAVIEPEVVSLHTGNAVTDGVMSGVIHGQSRPQIHNDSSDTNDGISQASEDAIEV